MTTRSAVIWVVLAGSLWAGRSVSAGEPVCAATPRPSPPPACAPDLAAQVGHEGYVAGWEVGVYSIDAAFDAFGGCPGLGELAVAIDGIVARQPAPSTDAYALCRHGGFYDAIAHRLRDLSACCGATGSCGWHEAVGRMYASYYCAAESATAGEVTPARYSAPPALSACPGACAGEFDATARRRASCRAFTTGEHRAGFDASRAHACRVTGSQ